jgi:hypothetical protein
LLFWFAGMAVALVWSVFKDPAIDYRLVVAGALLPDVVDAGFGGARIAHTLLASVSLLVVVMVVTRGRRPWRKRLLAVPIGMMCHLLLDGVWTNRQLFWWPAFGRALNGRLPSLDRPFILIAVQELVGVAALAWFWRRSAPLASG